MLHSNGKCSSNHWCNLGMVDRERRSMAARTEVARTVRPRMPQITTLILCLAYILQSQLTVSAALDTKSAASYALNDTAPVVAGATVALGQSDINFMVERQPLRKKSRASFVGTDWMTTTTKSPSTTRSTSSPLSLSLSSSSTTERSANSLLRKSNNALRGAKSERYRDMYTLISDSQNTFAEGRGGGVGDGRGGTQRQPKQLMRRHDVNILDTLLSAPLPVDPARSKRRELAKQATSTTTTTTSTTTTTTTTTSTAAPQQLIRHGELSMQDTILYHAGALPVNVSKADRLEMSTEFFVVPTPSTTSMPAPKTSRANPKARGAPALSSTRVGSKSISGTANASITPPTIVATHPQFMGLRKEPWVVPVLVLSALTMLMMGAFEIFVLFKAWRTSPSRRHLFLGQMLLLGLFACAGLGAVITAQPSLISCGAIRFGVGVAYALVFAALLVKCVFLISLNGGVYLPAPYQGLLLLFAVLIQVAIGAQWLLTQPPEIYTTSVPVLGNGFLQTTVASQTNFTALFYPSPPYSTIDGPEVYTRIAAVSTMLIPLCKTQFSELLFSLIYIVFLIVFISVLAIKSRGIRDNYREATYIGLAIGGAIPIWLGWMLCGLAVAERHKDACIAFGLVATSATVFLVMFMPKGRQLAAMGKEGLYVEDREEQFSSLSRAGSGYSPSFFHFKPIKYGVMSGCTGLQSSATNTGNGASMKHCGNANNGGDRIALVTTAAPPSYTRMYHYFPAHLAAHPAFCYYPQPPPPPPPQLAPPPALTPLTLKQLGNSITSMTQAHIAKTLRYPGMFIRPDETNLYTTLEPTLSSNPNVYFQRGGAVHPGMMY